MLKLLLVGLRAQVPCAHVPRGAELDCNTCMIASPICPRAFDLAGEFSLSGNLSESSVPL